MDSHRERSVSCTPHRIRVCSRHDALASQQRTLQLAVEHSASAPSPQRPHVPQRALSSRHHVNTLCTRFVTARTDVASSIGSIVLRFSLQISFLPLIDDCSISNDVLLIHGSGFGVASLASLTTIIGANCSSISHSNDGTWLLCFLREIPSHFTVRISVSGILSPPFGVSYTCAQRHCARNQICVTRDSASNCECASGFAGPNCTDVNECLNASACSALESCSNYEGGYACGGCPQGYAQSADSCIDIDECAAPVSACGTLYACTNTQGSYECHCNLGAGAILNANGACVDVDECLLRIDNCPFACVVRTRACMHTHTHTRARVQIANVKNTIGSFECECGAGFTANASNCVDIDECTLGLCDTIIGSCVNTQGSFVCSCPSGYTLSNGRCANINECAPNSICGALLCVDTPGSYQCVCPAGYGVSAGICVDINECAVRTACEPMNGLCQNEQGNFSVSSRIHTRARAHCSQCFCNGPTSAGYDDVCFDIDECALGTAVCRFGEKCVNTFGNYTCVCAAGFTMKASVCVDVDECALGANCGLHAKCSNTAGSYECVCDAGWFNPGQLPCVDVDECRAALCPLHSTCTSESHTLALTRTLTICADSAGSFDCICNSGFVSTVTANGTICADVNECAQSPCATEATCINTLGAFDCHCNAGFTGNGFGVHGCTPTRCSATTCAQGMLCAVANGAASCFCAPGYHLVNSSCVDVNECGTANPCAGNVCVNTEGSYECRCASGFVGNGYTCAVDLNANCECGANSVCQFDEFG